MIVSPSRSQSSRKPESGVRLESLRPIAQRQIFSLMMRLAKSGNYQLYQEEIQKVISYERHKTANPQEGEEID